MRNRATCCLRGAAWRAAVVAGAILALFSAAAVAGEVVLLEAEAFGDTGGWVADQQFMDQMGSPFLLAHGLGVPVKDAETTARFPAAGAYRLYVRTRDWVAPWKAPGTPGRFQVLIGGKACPVTFGTEGAEWHWQDGGTVDVPAGDVRVVLHDLTGFEGRCDAILFAAADFQPPEKGEELAAFRRKALGLPQQPADAGEFDLVVVGGGIAGTCAALAAARLDMKVALVQNRPVLGGNNSSEVRVWLGGGTNLQPYPRVGDVVRELEPRRKGHPGTAEMYEDDRRIALVKAEKNLALFLNYHVNRVEMASPSAAPVGPRSRAAASQRSGGRIRAVIAEHVRTGRRLRLAGRWFADCTGHGCIGYLAGAEHDMTRPGHMGRSNLWSIEDTHQPQAFPRCPWAIDLSERPFPASLGKWFWEAGFDHDPLEKGEHIRDTNFRAMYGAWDCLKNVRKQYPTHRLAWAAYISGPRESRRLLGDVVLTKEDLVSGKDYPDGCAPATWSIDVHVPNGRYSKGFEGDAFISQANYTGYRKPYWVPYRCLYSRNVANLFMAGRDISVTHEALGAVRVMRTTGMMGEVVGMAASVCRTRGVDGRAVYTDHLDDLKELMRRGVGKLPPVSRPGRQAAGAAPVVKDPPWLIAAGPNLARAAKLTVSGTLDERKYPPARVNDGRCDVGDNDARWVSDGKLPAFVAFTWDAPQTMGAARILSGWRQGGGISAPLTAFVLQHHDGIEWQDVTGASVTGNQAFHWHATFPPVRTDRLRLLVTAAPNDRARVWEVELYGPPKPPGDTAPRKEPGR